MNTVTLIGTLTRDPEIRDAGDMKICNMRVAERGSDQNTPLFISVSAFGRQAESCQEYLAKGRHIAVAGHLRFREWENDEGRVSSEYSIAAARVDFLPGSQNGGVTAPTESASRKSATRQLRLGTQ